jgi:FlgD Ig-like domain
MIGRWTIPLAALATCALPVASPAATLPPHQPLRILIVSDQVNPHGLSNAQLTQPGDLSATLVRPGTGLTLDASSGAVREIPTDSLTLATAALSVPITDPSAYDVLIYFAHRIPITPNAMQEQADFTAAVNAFLVAGGGLISFHHGSYAAAGKAGILDIIGGTATGSVPWNTVDGQNVINVAPAHFITTNGVEYSGNVTYADLARGIPSASYPWFNNTPDERYPNFQINASADTVAMLFASNYVEGGSTHVLGFTHRRPVWSGVVVVYQPGEYQPNALDDLEGNNFQILANAIVYAAYGALSVGVEEVAREWTLRASPNPFRTTTTIELVLAKPSEVDVAVYDVTGARVKTLVRGAQPAGSHRVRWDGRRDDGVAMPPGLYFCRSSVDGLSSACRLVLVR